MHSKEPNLPQAGLKYLLALEAMFDPDGQERGRNQRAAEQASTFAATSLKQKREMKNFLLSAYKHRGALQHWETRQERLQAANKWFGDNEVNLRTIVAWSSQRVLRLHAGNIDFEPASYIKSMPKVDRQGGVAALLDLPLYWAAMAKEFTVLNPMMWEASGSNIEHLASGGVKIEFLGQ